MWRKIKDAHQIQHGGTMTALEMNVNGNWTRKEIKSEVELGITENDRKHFILTYVISIMD